MLSILMVLGLFSACSNPSAFNEERAVFFSPDLVIGNLVNSYNEKDIDAYLSSFSDTSRFFDGDIYLWDIEQEKRLHETMFINATEINLRMQQLGSKSVGDQRVQAAYRYQLRLKISGVPTLLGEGEAVLEFLKSKANTWKVESFREMKIGLRKKVPPVIMSDDSLDYFPLRVGNTWTYEEVFAPNIPDIQAAVIDSLILKENLYYSLQNSGFPFFSKLLRVAPSWQYRVFFIEDSSEHTIFDFTSSVGDSTLFMLPGTNAPSVVELISHQDSLEVPAGTFSNVLEFLITDFDSGSRFFYEFAANVGIIRQRGTNQILALKSALVNGNKYPIITSVQLKTSSWTQIKNTFHKG